MKISIVRNEYFLFSICLPLLLASIQVIAQTNVVTQHNDLYRTGWDSTETVLNTKNVKPATFGKLYTRAVDDQIYAQLLVMNHVALPGNGNKNIVIAATVNNSVYAYDADSASVSAPYWQVNLTPTGLRAVKNTDMTGACGGNYKDFSGNIGIVSTPVIDSVTGTIYVVARSCATNGTGFVQYLHALDISTGNERPNSPVLITAQIAGNGSGNVGGIVSFNPQKENQRSGLLLLNGNVYITYASHCDWGPYHGWILGYDKSTLNQTVVYNDTPNGYNGGIWMAGAAPAADEAGNIYVSTGNGSAGYNGNLNDPINRSESAIKLTPSGSTLAVSSFFTPSNYATLEGGDLDFGDIEFMLLPHTNQGITGCKDGNIYLLDRDNMGGFNSGSNNVIQTINLGTNARMHSSFGYYRGSQKEYVYVWSENVLLKAFPYNRILNNFDIANTVSSGVQGPVGNSGAFLSVSSNGSIDSTAILWAAFAANGDANQSVRPGVLHAFEANDITREIWNSTMVAGDSVGNYAKFNCPTISNGKVYLATFSKRFNVYGLTGNAADTCNSNDVAENKPAFASSSENGTNTPDKAFDGDPSTRWASAQKIDPQYIYVDLGQDYDLCQVFLQWEVALGKNFTIDVSDDAVTWTTLATITNNLSFSNYIPLKGRGRYVRMFGTARGTNYGYSLYSFQVYGTPAPGNCPVPDSLTTSDIFENTATLHWRSTGAPNYTIQYKAVTATDWTMVSSDTNLVVLDNLACGTDYLFRVQSTCSVTDTSTYSGTSSFSQLACGSNCNPLPTRWSSLDIGNTGLPGNACYNGGTFTVRGSGDDIGGTEDAFHFAQKTLVGDGQFDARVRSLDNTDPSNKCGIMIRETLAPGSKYVFIALTSGNGAYSQYRSTTDGNTNVSTNSGTLAPPYWVRLIKTGSIYSASVSPDGFNYTPIGGQVDAGFGSNPIYAGLAITSHNNTMLSTGQVDNYQFTTGVLPLQLLSFNANLNLEQRVNIAWQTTLEMNTSYFVLQRSGPDYIFEDIYSVKANNNGSYTSVYSTIDNTPLNGINFYRLKMVDADGHTSYSALVMVRVNNFQSPTLYPNPARTYINIAGGSDPVKYITIFDMTGKTIMSYSNISNTGVTRLNTSGLMRGSYIVEIKTSTNVYRDKLLIL